MGHRDYSWTTKEQFKLFAQAWTPDSEIKAVLALVHGFGEHSRRYQNVARILNRERYALIGLDLRGHGRTGGPRGHLSYEEASNDVDLLSSEA